MYYFKIVYCVILLTTFIVSNVLADDTLDLIKPTGYWYTEASIDYGDLDGCLLHVSSTSTRYEGLFSSFETAKTAYFNKHYRGGKCIETITDATWRSPDDWPLINNWDIYQKQYPGSPGPKDVDFTCSYPNNNGVDYFFAFLLQPQYKCIDGSCNHYKKACAGDVYAGDLLHFPAEQLGHTGIIYTSDDADPNNSNLVLEVLRTPPIIHSGQSLNDIQKERPIWGVRYGYGKLGLSGEMSLWDALKMTTLGFIQTQYCPQYTFQPIYKVGGFSTVSVTNPINHRTKEITTANCAVFRCDTFVQYLYKEAMDTELPPRDALQAPKDLFNAFPNQRGDIIQTMPNADTVNISNKAHKDANNSDLWASYHDPKSSFVDRATYLDSIDAQHSIGFSALIAEINTENNSELKSKLLYLVIKKIKEEDISKDDWSHLKKIVLRLLHDSSEPKTLVNVLVLGELILTPQEITSEVKTLSSRISSKFPVQELIMVNNSINLALFEAMINSDSNTVHTAITDILKAMDRESVTESFAVYINDFPEEKLHPIRKYLHDYIAKAKPGYFHTRNFFKNNYRAKLWSNALLKVKDSTISSTDELYHALTNLEDEFARSLIILENKDKITTPDDKLKFLKLIHRDHHLNPKDNNPMEKTTINQANLFLTN